MAMFVSCSVLRRAKNSPCLTQILNFSTRQCSSFSFGEEEEEEIDSSNFPRLTTPKLFITGLSRFTTDDKLKEAFSRYGQLLECKVITDRISGQSRGFGFIRYARIEDAQEARRRMNGCFLDGWVIFIEPALPRIQKKSLNFVTNIRENKAL